MPNLQDGTETVNSFLFCPFNFLLFLTLQDGAAVVWRWTEFLLSGFRLRTRTFWSRQGGAGVALEVMFWFWQLFHHIGFKWIFGKHKSLGGSMEIDEGHLKLLFSSWIYGWNLGQKRIFFQFSEWRQEDKVDEESRPLHSGRLPLHYHCYMSTGEWLPANGIMTKLMKNPSHNTLVTSTITVICKQGTSKR